MSWQSDVLRHAFAFEPATVTPYTFATVLMPVFFSYYVMAVLVQLPRTELHRAALLPVVLWMAIRANMSVDLSCNHPAYAHVNQGLSLAMFSVAMRSTAWVFAKRPYARIPSCKSANGTTNGHNGHSPTDSKHGVSVPSALWNALDLIVNLRGIGWNWSERMHVSTPYFRVESRSIFVLLSFCRFALLTFVLDALCGSVRSLGPDTFGSPVGGTIFDPSLAPTERYTKSLIVTLLSGTTAYVIIETFYQLHAVVFTILFQQHPSQWPPLFDSPWLSTSLTSLWGQRWHQLFREPFVALGSKPMERFFGKAGVVMGAFAISGVLHDVGMQGMGRGADTFTVVGFFLMHGVGVSIEYAWRRATGRRVGGIVGWLWVFCWLVLWGQLVVDVWARRGLLGSEVLPEAYRPTMLLLNWISGENGAA